MISLQQILIPTDLSEPSLAATRYALEFARRFQARLHLLYVIHEPPYYAPLGGYMPSRDEWSAFADTALQNWISEDDIGHLEVVREKVVGHPATSILEYAQQHNIDLIVMGTHGRTALAHLVLGSVAENVVRQSRCPVLTIRPDQHNFVMP